MDDVCFQKENSKRKICVREIVVLLFDVFPNIVPNVVCYEVYDSPDDVIEKYTKVQITLCDNNPVGSVVTEILNFRQSDRQTDQKSINISFINVGTFSWKVGGQLVFPNIKLPS